MYKWSLTDHVPKQFTISGTYRLLAEGGNVVTELYDCAQLVSSFSERLSLAAVLEDFYSTKIDGTYIYANSSFMHPLNC